MARHWCRWASLFFLAWMLFETGSTFPHQDKRGESGTQNTNKSEAKIILDNLYNNTQNEQDATDHANKRHKRTIIADPSREWTKGIIPFVYMANNDERSINYYELHMGTYQRFTCIQFVPWTKENGVTTNTKLGLDHQNYLKFENHHGCNSLVGNHRGQGQKIHASCGGTHELGHLLGLFHEDESPHPERYWTSRYNRNYRKMKRRGMMIPVDPKRVVATEYDMSGYMTYSWESDVTGIGPQVTFLFQDEYMPRATYYMMREISNKHKCASTYCSDFKLTCENDGYLTLVDGHCACRCIPGLDPSTGCRTIYKQDPPELTFPGGPFAMPKPKTGCPAGFKTGSRSFVTAGKNTHSAAYDLDGKVTRTQVEQSFCVSFAQKSKIDWPGGRYCLYRKGGSCPTGLKAGAVEFDDQGNSKSTGTLPDGAFGEKTKLEYCCKNTVVESNYEVFLPSRKAIVLMKYPGQACQLIRGMHDYVQKITIKQNQQGGITSYTGYVPVTQENPKNSTIEFCHYRPAKIDCGDAIHLTADNPEVTITSPSDPELECFWLFKAPPGERVTLDFISHNVKCETNAKLKVRHRKPGYPPWSKCGDELDRTIVSVNNTLHLQFSTYGATSASFKAKAKLVQNSNLCYNKEDRGQSYDGKVNVTRLFKKCVPWSEVSHCPYSAFHVNIPFNAILKENYCRNPDQKTGIIPWCYTSPEFCLRDYCDVCQLQRPVDNRYDCKELRSAGKCPDHGCAKTCKDETPTDIPIDASTVKCGSPPDVADGELIDERRNRYSVGDNVTYQCRTDEKKQRKRLCLTTGEWSPLAYVCDVCPSGWLLFHGDCIAKVAHYLTFDDAERRCQEIGAEIVTSKDVEKNDFLSFTFVQDFWLGLRRKGDVWSWRDGQKMTFNFLRKKNSDYHKCAFMDRTAYWIPQGCQHNYHKHSAVCSVPAGDSPPCVDFLPECPRWFQENSKLCVEFQDLATAQCRYTCGLCNADDTPKCPVESPGPQVTAPSSREPIKRGQVVKYGCSGDYVPTQGDTVRGCDASGRLLGSTLVCSPGCQKGWKYNEESVSCYKYFHSKTGFNYFEAKKTCRSLGGNVAMPKSKGQNDLLTQLRIRGDGKFQWIGMHRVFNWTKAEEKFLWDDGQEIQYSKWRTRANGDIEPSYENRELCVSLIDVNNWMDGDCNGKMNFTCQVPLKKIKSSDQRGPCPPGWLLDSGKCYGVYGWLDFYAAKAFCQFEDAQLPAPKSEKEFEYLKSIYKVDFWIDLQDTDKDGSWRWGDGTPLGWNKWHQPADKRRGRDCGVVYGKGWDANYCNTTSASVLCVKPAADTRK